MAATIDQARSAKANATRTFSAFGEVAGVGIVPSDGGYGLKVNLVEQPAPDARLPSEVDGVPTRVEVVGRVRQLQPA